MNRRDFLQSAVPLVGTLTLTDAAAAEAAEPPDPNGGHAEFITEMAIEVEKYRAARLGHRPERHAVSLPVKGQKPANCYYLYLDEQSLRGIAEPKLDMLLNVAHYGYFTLFALVAEELWRRNRPKGMVELPRLTNWMRFDAATLAVTLTKPNETITPLVAEPYPNDRPPAPDRLLAERLVSSRTALDLIELSNFHLAEMLGSVFDIAALTREEEAAARERFPDGNLFEVTAPLRTVVWQQAPCLEVYFYAETAGVCWPK